jgi:hypothetical protein
MVLWCAEELVLLIACMNLCHVSWCSWAARSKEFAMRAALGVGLGRLIGQQMAMPENQRGERR